MNAGDIARTDYTEISPYVPTAQVVDRLAARRFLVVRDTREFLGLLTPADLIQKAHRLVIDCLTKKPEVTPQTPLDEVLQLMEEHSLFALPVLEEGALTGVVTQGDILRHTSRYSENMHTHFERIERLDALELLSAGIAHDLNNLLTSMLGHASLAAMGLGKEPTLAQNVAEIEEAAARAQGLVQQLLRFSQHGMPATRTDDTSRLIRESARFFALGSRFHMRLHVADDLEAITADADALSRIIANLVMNAKQAMPEGGVITLEAVAVTLGPANEASLPEGEYVRLSLSDTGTGIEPGVIPCIFDPFFTTKPDGNGVGLTIVQRLVSRAGGHVAVQSDPGRGTTFAVHLPVRSIGSKIAGASENERFGDVLRSGCFCLDLKGETKEDIIAEMVAALAEQGELSDPDAVIAAVLAREERESTGMQHGVAMPHGKTGTVGGLVTAFGLSRRGVDFGSLDGSPARIFIMTISPSNRSGPHIRYLSQVSRVLRNPFVREQLLNSRSSDEMIRLLSARS